VGSHQVSLLRDVGVEAVDVRVGPRGHHATVDKPVPGMRPGGVDGLEELHQPPTQRAVLRVAARIPGLAALGALHAREAT